MALTIEELEQRKAEALKILGPLGFKDLDDGECPGAIYIDAYSLSNKPGMSMLSFDVERYASTEALLQAVMPKVAEHCRAIGRKEIQEGFRQLMHCAAPTAQWQLDQEAEEQERYEHRMEDRIRQIAREEARRS